MDIEPRKPRQILTHLEPLDAAEAAQTLASAIPATHCQSIKENLDETLGSEYAIVTPYALLTSLDKAGALNTALHYAGGSAQTLLQGLEAFLTQLNYTQAKQYNYINNTTDTFWESCAHSSLHLAELAQQYKNDLENITDTVQRALLFREVQLLEKLADEMLCISIMQNHNPTVADITNAIGAIYPKNTKDVFPAVIERRFDKLTTVGVKQAIKEYPDKNIPLLYTEYLLNWVETHQAHPDTLTSDEKIDLYNAKKQAEKAINTLASPTQSSGMER